MTFYRDHRSKERRVIDAFHFLFAVLRGFMHMQTDSTQACEKRWRRPYGNKKTCTVCVSTLWTTLASWRTLGTVFVAAPPSVSHTHTQYSHTEREVTSNTVILNWEFVSHVQTHVNITSGVMEWWKHGDTTSHSYEFKVWWFNHKLKRRFWGDWRHQPEQSM